MFPNPTSGRAKLELQAGTRATVTVADLSGRLISQATATNGYEINLEGYAPGMYLVIVQPKGKNAVTFKLQKQ
ncbi:T9SS type A sorting domain-containing protein [Pontibacter brevis]